VGVVTTVYWLTDSFGQTPLTNLCQDMLGWVSVADDFHGGAGYVNDPFAEGNFVDHLPTVIAAAPDVLIVMGGQNDSFQSDAALSAAASAFWTGIRAGLPTVRAISTLCYRQPLMGPTKVAAIIDACARSGVEYVDWSGWMTGTGNVSDPHGDGNADLYLSADGTHPSTAGWPHFGAKFAYALGANNLSGIVTESGARLMLEDPA
jgi:lysophospholipase L1-like esterase